MPAYRRFCRLEAILYHSYGCLALCLALEALQSVCAYVAYQKSLLWAESLEEVQSHGITHDTKAWNTFISTTHAGKFQPFLSVVMYVPIKATVLAGEEGMASSVLFGVLSFQSRL